VALTTTSGTLLVKAHDEKIQLEGAICATNSSGPITILSSAGSVDARSGSGLVTVKVAKLPTESWIFIEADTGDVQLTLPPKINAHLQAKVTSGGSITSSLPVTLEPRTVLLNKKTWKLFQREVAGWLGKGGAPITVDILNGSLRIEPTIIEDEGKR
jgi:hypothetical protein